VLLVIVVGLAVPIAACSATPAAGRGSADSPRAAVTPSPGTDGSPAAGSAATLQREVLAYAACMRSHGVPMPNLPAPASLPRNKPTAQPAAVNGPDPDSPQFEAAQQACQSLLPPSVQGG
jgi:hypothetical protein